MKTVIRLENPLSERIVEPGILVRTAHAGEHSQCLARQLLVIGQFAAVGHQALRARAG